MATTLWYVRVLAVDRSTREFRVWICRWYSDETLPSTFSFFVMMLYEMFEQSRPEELDLEILSKPETTPEDLMVDYNPPKNPRKYVEHVEMISWCGVNERVRHDDNDADEIHRLTNELQAEYLVRLTDCNTYLSCRAEPSDIVGSFCFDSTAYDCPNDGTEIAIGGGAAAYRSDTILRPRCEFMIDSRVARQYYASYELQKLHQKLNALTNFQKKEHDADPKVFAGLMFGLIADDRELFSLAMLDSVTMKYQATRRLLDDIDYLCGEKLWDVMDEEQHDETAIQLLRQTYEDVVRVAVKDDIVFMIGGRENPLEWVARAVTSAAGKDGEEMLHAMAVCHPANQ